MFLKLLLAEEEEFIVYVPVDTVLNIYEYEGFIKVLFKKPLRIQDTSGRFNKNITMLDCLEVNLVKSLKLEVAY